MNRPRTGLGAILEESQDDAPIVDTLGLGCPPEGAASHKEPEGETIGSLHFRGVLGPWTFAILSFSVA